MNTRQTYFLPLLGKTTLLSNEELVNLRKFGWEVHIYNPSSYYNIQQA